jgi:hypothetical protein|tara:strand:+ start:1067 stop:1486 length:420 start_codon:yes stop_codon:yes gene_type:complete
MKLKESELRRIVRKIIIEDTSIPKLSAANQLVADDIIKTLLTSQNKSVSESSFKDIARGVADIGFRLGAFKATIPMIASGIIIYCNYNNIPVDALSLKHASLIVDFLGLQGGGAVEVIINVIAGIGGAYGVAKGLKSLD